MLAPRFEIPFYFSPTKLSKRTQRATHPCPLMPLPNVGLIPD